MLKYIIIEHTYYAFVLALGWYQGKINKGLSAYADNPLFNNAFSYYCCGVFCCGAAESPC